MAEYENTDLTSELVQQNLEILLDRLAEALITSQYVN